jgi:hypothetical protein
MMGAILAAGAIGLALFVALVGTANPGRDALVVAASARCGVIAIALFLCEAVGQRTDPSRYPPLTIRAVWPPVAFPKREVVSYPRAMPELVLHGAPVATVYDLLGRSTAPAEARRRTHRARSLAD